MNVLTRVATPDDLRFVHSSWHTSHWKSWAHKHIEREEYAPGQDRRIAILLARAETVVAYFPEAPTEILGWVCAEPYRSVLHYVYVKGVYRERGIARGLVEPMKPRWYTHYVDARGRTFAAAMKIQFNPYKENP